MNCENKLYSICPLCKKENEISRIQAESSFIACNYCGCKHTVLLNSKVVENNRIVFQGYQIPEKSAKNILCSANSVKNEREEDCKQYEDHPSDSNGNPFWPAVNSIEEARNATKYGVAAAGFSGIVTAFAAAVGYINRAAFLDAAIFGGIAYGIYKEKRWIAVFGLVFFLFQKYDQVANSGKLTGAWMVAILLLCYVTSIRGVFALERLRKEIKNGVTSPDKNEIVVSRCAFCKNEVELKKDEFELKIFLCPNCKKPSILGKEITHTWVDSFLEKTYGSFPVVYNEGEMVVVVNENEESKNDHWYCAKCGFEMVKVVKGSEGHSVEK